MMKINVRSLTSDPEAFSAEVDPAELELGPDWEARGPAWVQCRLHRLGDKVFVKGTAEVAIQTACSRCLSEFEQKIQSPFVFVAIPAHLAGTAHRAGRREQCPEGEDEERRPDEDDQNVVEYTGDQLDLVPEIRTALILAMPMKPLCREDCPGLCAECGGRLAAGPPGTEGLCTCRKA